MHLKQYQQNPHLEPFTKLYIKVIILKKKKYKNVTHSRMIYQ